MAESIAHVRTTRAALQQALASIPKETLTGGSVARSMLIRCGMALLGRIKQAFIVKARGGTDEAGDRWAPLSPKTIAYSRRHPGVPKAAVRATSRPSWMLTSRQRDRWWDLYRQGLAIFKGNKGSAARRAWSISKSEGATTLIDKYGNTQVEILRDTGLLLNSLSPGVSTPEQVFRIGPGEVIVGTNRKGAATHHEGKGHIPQRRLWPEPRKWPQSWWQDILEQVRQGVIDITLQIAKGA